MRKMMGVAVLAVLCTAAFSQDGPPKILSISREEVKPGRGPAHELYEARWAQAIKAKSKTPYIGMVSINSNEAMWVVGYDSYAALEKDSAATDPVMAQFVPGDADNISGNRSMIARFRDDLSYNVSGGLGGAHGFTITTVRTRPGHANEYEELRKTVKAVLTRVNPPNAHVAVYQVAVGAPTGTFLVFSPFTSLAERDATAGQPSPYSTEEQAKLNDLASKAIITSEPAIYMFSPKMSNPPPNMVAAAPDFWKPKAAMSKTSTDAGKKPAAKASEKAGK